VNLYGSKNPNAITVAQGTTVTFRGNWLEPHTVTFVPAGQPVPPPGSPDEAVPTHPGQVPAINGSTFVNSGFIIQNAPPGAPVVAQFQASFPNSGAFPFLCILHPGMAGTVRVVAPGTAGISTQAELDATANSTFAPALTALKAEAARLAAQPVTQARNADGSTTWRVNTVGGFVAPNDVQQFIPAAMNIREGDTVVWESSVPTPHTVTFLGGQPFGAPIGSLEDPRLAPSQAPAAGYSGAGYVNSGLVFGPGTPVPFPFASTFAVKFASAGSFPFICILHVDQGMGGVINVSAAAPLPPATGTAGFASTSTPASAAAMLGILTLVIAGGTRALSARLR
jgi:plastocyanin